MLNRTLFYGEGLFETILWRGRTKKLLKHYERLKNSAKFFQIPCPNFESFCKEIEKKTENKKNLYVKFCLLSKAEGDYHSLPQSSETLVIVKEYNSTKKPQKLYISSIKRHSSDPIIYHKTMNYLSNILVKREALSHGFDDGVILNEKDEITECSSSNILIVKNNKFLTPYHQCGLLMGTTLQILMNNLRIKEERLKINNLLNSSAVFITNSLIGALPVIQIMDKNYFVDKELLGYLNLLIDKENSVTAQNIME